MRWMAAAEQLDLLAAGARQVAREVSRRDAEAARVSSAIGSEKRREALAPIRKSSRQAPTIAPRIVQR